MVHVSPVDVQIESVGLWLGGVGGAGAAVIKNLELPIFPNNFRYIIAVKTITAVRLCQDAFIALLETVTDVFFCCSTKEYITGINATGGGGAIEFGNVLRGLGNAFACKDDEYNRRGDIHIERMPDKCEL